MGDSGRTPAAAMLESSQQRFAARLANVCTNKLKNLHQYPSSGTPVCRAVTEEYKHGQITDCKNRPALGNKSVVRTVILDDTTTAKRAAQRWVPKMEANVGARIRKWCTDGLHPDDGPVRAAAGCKHRVVWRSHRSYLGTGRIGVFHIELWAIRLTLDLAVEK